MRTLWIPFGIGSEHLAQAPYALQSLSLCPATESDECRSRLHKALGSCIIIDPSQSRMRCH